MKKISKALIAAAGSAVSVSVAFSAFMMEQTVHGKRQTPEEALNWQKAHYDISFYEPLEKEDYTVSCGDGYVLHAQLVKNPEGSDRYVIITHGYTDTRYGMLKYMKIYLDLGYNCVIYDIRDHGENERSFCTYSIREAQDLTAVIDDAYGRFGPDIHIGLHGESLGAATTVRSLMYHPRVDFAVADCGFADIENVLLGVYARYHLPAAVVRIASALAKLRYGYAFSEMRPIDALQGNKVPILFVHGADDTFITPDNSIRMKEATGGYADLLLVPGAGHAKSVLTDPEGYAERVKVFLEKTAAESMFK